jgi:tRNA(Ile)-lysidine synthetase-like protein
MRDLGLSVSFRDVSSFLQASATHTSTSYPPDPDLEARVLATDRTLEFPYAPAGKLIIRPLADGALGDGERAVWLPEMVELRKRLPGDRFRPPNCSHHTKLKKYLIDKKAKANLGRNPSLLSHPGSREVLWIFWLAMSHEMVSEPPTHAVAVG